MIFVPSFGGVTIVSIRARPPGVSTTRVIAGCLLAGRLRLTLKVRLNRSQRHRPKGRSGWFIGVHSWRVSEWRLVLAVDRRAPALAGALTGSKRKLPNQPERARPVEGVGSVPRAELAVDVAGVALDGAHGDEEIPGCLGVGLARGEYAQHLELTLAQRALELLL